MQVRQDQPQARKQAVQKRKIVDGSCGEVVTKKRCLSKVVNSRESGPVSLEHTESQKDLEDNALRTSLKDEAVIHLKKSRTWWPIAEAIPSQGSLGMPHSGAQGIYAKPDTEAIPRQGLVFMPHSGARGVYANPDTDEFAVDPRQGLVFMPHSGAHGVYANPDTDKFAVDPRQGLVFMPHSGAHGVYANPDTDKFAVDSERLAEYYENLHIRDGFGVNNEVRGKQHYRE
ncbi:hypothetical protein ACP70R_012187 [Stipagrostis hirtigluma subsp. patula]